MNEVFGVEAVEELCAQWCDPSVPMEVILVNYLQKKVSKEIPHSNNGSVLQSMVDESNCAEWLTILDKQAVKIHCMGNVLDNWLRSILIVLLEVVL